VSGIYFGLQFQIGLFFQKKSGSGFIPGGNETARETGILGEYGQKLADIRIPPGEIRAQPEHKTDAFKQGFLAPAGIDLTQTGAQGLHQKHELMQHLLILVTKRIRLFAIQAKHALLGGKRTAHERLDLGFPGRMIITQTADFPIEIIDQKGLLIAHYPAHKPGPGTDPAVRSDMIPQTEVIGDNVFVLGITQDKRDRVSVKHTADYPQNPFQAVICHSCPSFEMPLEIKLQTPIIRLFLFLGKITGRQFASLTVIMQTFTTQSVPGAALICTGTVFGIYFRPGAFIQFFHF
jgi:hypothetical protein